MLQRDEHKGKIWVKPQQSKWYYVTATDFKYDKTIDSVFVNVIICGNDTVGIDKEKVKSKKAKVKVYPNPAKDEIIIEISGDLNNLLNYELYSIDGRLIQKGKINKTKNKIDISKIDAGIYILKILNNCELIYNDKLIKE